MKNLLMRLFQAIAIACIIMFSQPAEAHKLSSYSIPETENKFVEPADSAWKKKPKRLRGRHPMFQIKNPNKFFNLKYNLAGLPFGRNELLPELRLTRFQSLTLGINMGNYRVEKEGIRQAFSFAPEYRYYTFTDSKSSFEGGYVGGYINYTNESSEQNIKHDYLGFGGIVGHQWILYDRFNVDFYFGGGWFPYINSRYPRNLNPREFDAPGRIGLRLGIAVGICLD